MTDDDLPPVLPNESPKCTIPACYSQSALPLSSPLQNRLEFRASTSPRFASALVISHVHRPENVDYYLILFRLRSRFAFIISDTMASRTDFRGSIFMNLGTAPAPIFVQAHECSQCVRRIRSCPTAGIHSYCPRAHRCGEPNDAWRRSAIASLCDDPDRILRRGRHARRKCTGSGVRS